MGSDGVPRCRSGRSGQPPPVQHWLPGSGGLGNVLAVTDYRALDHEYRAFVGPPEQYDVIGAAQFALLYALGLRQHHRLLDVGCGSLRAGRLLIAYLEPGNYFAVEPHTWLIDEAIKNQVGKDLIDIKRPTFRATDRFDFSGFGTFDFVLVQGVATNAGPTLVPVMLRAIREALAPRGICSITFVHPGTVDPDVVCVDPDDSAALPWLYPNCYAYERHVVERWVTSASLFGGPIPWYHPRQTWWLLALAPEVLPPSEFLSQLTGPTLVEGFEPSWRP
jgi:SAM-dependent methyltransferase